MGLSAQDYENLIASLNQLINQVPGFVKGGILNQSLPDYLSFIPYEFRKYTVAELMESIRQAWGEGKIRW
ncbi:MAG: hypothetical protein A2Y33_13880 [Spirochaetes bacterium GWF1_51_8]|nr:MAG: hypothetical protein A2Y33_13880 [Spirochaetes bacterium GWF1_51_8]